MRKNRLLNNLAVQAALVIVGLAVVSLALSVSLYQRSMQEIALDEVENRAIIFLSAIEAPVRRLVLEKNTESLVETLRDQAEFLKDNLNFVVVGVVVRDKNGVILERMRRNPDGTVSKLEIPDGSGQNRLPEDFQTVLDSGAPLVLLEVKQLKLLEGQPRERVIEVLYPISKRQGDEILGVIKLYISVEQTFALLRDRHRGFMVRNLSGLVLVTLLLIAGILFFVRRRVIMPLLSINRGAERVASGDLTTRLEPAGAGEIRTLIDHFNRMVQALVSREQMRRSLELAREVQQNLLPRTAPEIPGLDIAGQSIYCDETGGDYFDYIGCDEQPGKIGIVIGDVSGHGISSALLMASTRAFLRQRAALPGSIAAIVSDVNVQFSRDVADSGSFMSLFYLCVDRGERCLRWVRAGHDPAMRYDRNSGSAAELKGPGIALGVDPHFRFEEQCLQDLGPGQIILLGTDGIWEARNRRGEMFGKEALQRLLERLSDRDAQAVLAGITGALDEFRQGAPVEDDVTLIVVKITEAF